MAIPISAIVLTKNEEANVRACLDTIRWADEVLVVDSLSTDTTVEIAQSLGARVLLHPFNNFAAQHNYAQEQAQHDWVFFVDADERVSPQLRDEIQALAANGKLEQMNAYQIQRVHLFSGIWMPDPEKRKFNARLIAQIRRREVPRLMNRTQANWTRPLHEEVRVPEPIGVLEGILLHYSTTNLSAALAKFNYYSDLEAAYLDRAHRRATVLEAVFRGLRAFAFQYFIWGMFRYGEQGLLFSIIAGMSKFMNYAKLAERSRIAAGRGIWTEQDRRLLTQYSVVESVES